MHKIGGCKAKIALKQPRRQTHDFNHKRTEQRQQHKHCMDWRSSALQTSASLLSHNPKNVSHPRIIRELTGGTIKGNVDHVSGRIGLEHQSLYTFKRQVMLLWMLQASEGLTEVPR